MGDKMTIDWRQTLGWRPSAEQLQQFEQFYQLLLVANQSLNLTRITSREDFWEKHIWDSLAGIVPWLSVENQDAWMMDLVSAGQDVQTVIDIGTGGGVPGIPGAIACPHWQMSLLDSTQKKIHCLAQVLHDLNGLNVTTLCDRAEQLGHAAQHRGQYDLALIRAVATAPVCAEYAIPLLREQGIAVLYRGQWNATDEVGLCQALDVLGGELCHIQSWTTPISNSDRHCIYLKKTKPTPDKYARRIGVPTKKPLG